MPVIGKGTWMTNIGKKFPANVDDVARITEIQRVLDSGITVIDTAERYANGYMETVLGKVLSRSDREKQFLSSKVSSDHLEYDDLILSAKRSLKRMHVAYFNLYLIHQWNPEIDSKETMKAMDFLIEQKLIRNIGVCNFTVEQLEKAQSYTKNKIVANMVHYNVLFREPEEAGIIAYCQKHDIMIIAWRPFEQERLSPKIKAMLDALADTYKISPSQVALLWLIAQKNTVVLSKLNTQVAIDQTLGAMDTKINDKDFEKLSEASNI